tara:strand:+ start:172 stop:912 length:741 start_codon:yes stop_codon:yes gene_type:complete
MQPMEMTLTDSLTQLSDDLWIADGEAVRFFTLPYTTRMTIVRLTDGRLFIHSPIRLTESLQRQIRALGDVRYLIAPNHLHHLFIKDWAEAYPRAELYGTEEVIKKRADIDFSGQLNNEDQQQYPWQPAIRQLLFRGSAAMEECVFFHQPSSTLIVTDLIENFDPQSFTPFKRLIARASGILAPNGRTPIDWRLSFVFSRQQTRRQCEKILSWRPKRIVMAHGEIIHKGDNGQSAEDHLRTAFRFYM